MLTDVVDKPLDFRLHPPVSELDFTQFICTHDGVFPRVVLVLLNPVF